MKRNVVFVPRKHDARDGFWSTIQTLSSFDEYHNANNGRPQSVFPWPQTVNSFNFRLKLRERNNYVWSSTTSSHFSLSFLRSWKSIPRFYHLRILDPRLSIDVTAFHSPHWWKIDEFPIISAPILRVCMTRSFWSEDQSCGSSVFATPQPILRFIFLPPKIHHSLN
jgi:hypothetical protein